MAPKSPLAKGKGKEKGNVTKMRLKASDIQSTVTAKEIRLLNQEYDGYSFRKPREDERAHDFSETELCIYSRHMRDGLWLPIPESLVAFFAYFGLVPAQLSPNALVYLLGLRKMFAKKLAWNMQNVMSFVRLGHGEPGVYHLKPANHNAFGFQGTPDSVHGWKEKFFFVTKHDGNWGFPTIPRVKQGPVMKDWPGITEEVIRFYLGFKCKYICLDVVGDKILPYDESPYLTKKRKAEEEVAAGEAEVPAKRRAKSTRGKKPRQPLVSETATSSETPETIPVEDSEEDDEAPGPVGDRDQDESSSEAESRPGMSGADSPREEAPAEERSEETSGSYSRPPGGVEMEAPEATEAAAPATEGANPPRLHSGGDKFSFEIPQSVVQMSAEAPDEFFNDVVSALLTTEDEDYLKTKTLRELLKLQTQLAVQSTVVASHMSLISFDRERVLRGRLRLLRSEKEAAEEQSRKAEEDTQASRLEAENGKKEKEEAEKRAQDLESRLNDAEVQSTKDRDSLASIQAAHADEIIKLSKELDEVRAEGEAKAKMIDVLKEEAQGFIENAKKYEASAEAIRSRLTADLRNREAEAVILQKAAEDNRVRTSAMAEEKKKAEAAWREAEALMKDEKRVAEEEKASLVRELEEIKEKLNQQTPVGPTPSAAEAKAAYLASVEFIEMKADLCERGFNICKYELASQGLLTEAQLECLNFLSVISKAVSK